MHPREIDVLDNGGMLRIIWQNDTASHIPAAELRARCPCVECRSRSHAPGGRSGIQSLSIQLSTDAARTIEVVHLISSSRILVVWKDGHDKSYYSFSTIREHFPPEPGTQNE